MSTKTVRIIGWVLTGLLAAFLLFSAYGKFNPPPEMAKMLEGTSITPETMRYIGIVEILCVVIWLIPRTAIPGTLLLCSYLGGAICFSIVKGLPVTFPALICALVWVASVLRLPELGRRLFGGNPAI